jgi:3-oxoacyl-[acyl-carrier-protein] synthase II
MTEKVLITGMGAITPLGNDARTTFGALLSGTSAITAAPSGIREFLPNAVAASIETPLLDLLPEEQHGALDRATQFALIASQEALRDADLQMDSIDRDRAGVHVGTSMGGSTTLDRAYRRLYGESKAKLYPFTLPNSMCNGAAAWLSIAFGLCGPSVNYSIACASSALALGEAYRAIACGAADIMLVVGTEAPLQPGPFLAWHALRALAQKDADEPSASCRPFSRDRSGIVLAEGAAAIVLESASHARARGREAYAELSGYSATSDAFHIAHPSRDGQVKAMRQALRSAGLAPRDIAYINAHGTASKSGDEVETAAIKDVFGADAYHVPISASKSMLGHPLGAAGTLEFLVAVRALHEGRIPPTANLREPDPACDLDYVGNGAREVGAMPAVMSNCFGLGGCNVSLIATRAGSGALH